MTRKLVVLTLLMISLLLVFGCQLSTTNDINPTASVGGSEIGKAAPDFTLQDLEGQTVTLSGLRGSPIMLNFWATWCSPCRHEMPFLQQVYEDWQDKGLVLLTINLRETLSEAMQFLQSNDLTFPVLLVTDGGIASKYNITGIPTTFFIDKDGIIQEKRLGSFSNAAEIENYLDSIMP